jgi:hypothetical protein
MGISLNAEELLPGERLVMSKSANMIISVKQSGLSRFAFDDLMWVVGMQSKEAIGGKAHLTNYRIVFKSHFFNRVRGSHSLFLPNVKSVAPKFNGLTVDTDAQSVEFVMWFTKGFITGVEEAKAALPPVVVERLRQAVLAHSGIIGAGLQKWTTLENINQICLGVRKMESIVETLSDPEKTTFLEIMNLLKPDE